MISVLPLLCCLIIFIKEVCSSPDYDQRYLNCSELFNCGRNSYIQYPFWGGSRAEYCGRPGYYLECLNKATTVIEIKSLKYQVLDVYQESQTLRIARLDYMDAICPSNYSNSILDLNLFDYTPDTLNLTLFYGCPPPPIPMMQTRFQFRCESSNSGSNFYAFYVTRNAPEEVPGCRWRVVVPIPEGDAERLERGASTLSDVLRDGFEVKHRVNLSECIECGKSGGSCGFDRRPTCFCYDGPRQGPCPYRPPSGRNNGLKIGIGVAAGVGGIVLGCVAFFIWQRRKKVSSSSSTLLSRNISPEPSSKGDVEKGESMLFHTPIFKYDELIEATENFDESKELGDGGFGTVYHGKLRDGREVAVKRLYEHNYKRVEQFMNEINILSRLRHRHLVSLYGCTSRDSRELLLVYEFVSNGTVADHLHGHHAKAGQLTWPVRMSIAIESADALTYLHATEIIHRDVKTNNILLDNNFHVKVADFGLSRLFPTDVTHVSTAPQGTPGYVDPEYYQCYQLNDRSDVYSFGVVLIELISSKPAVDINRHRHEINLASMAINKILNHALHELVDPRLGYDSDCDVRRMVTSVAELAFRCLQQEKEMRPTMKEVLESLKNIEDGKSKREKGEELDVAPEKGLLKAIPPFSPDSVTDKWASINTTPNTSA